MPQLIIDPVNRGPSVSEITGRAVPLPARLFGHVPDFRSCLPGDLILYCRRATRLIDQGIFHVQSNAGFSLEDSKWTHAAVLLYDDYLVEANPWSGVQTRNAYLDVPDYTMRVRRNLDLTDTERFRIALSASRLAGLQYSRKKAFLMWWRMKRGQWSSTLAIERVVICSKVFSDAYTEIMRNVLEGCAIDQPITPAHLSATTTLLDIAVGWRTIV